MSRLTDALDAHPYCDIDYNPTDEELDTYDDAAQAELDREDLDAG